MGQKVSSLQLAPNEEDKEHINIYTELPGNFLLAVFVYLVTYMKC